MKRSHFLLLLIFYSKSNSSQMMNEYLHLQRPVRNSVIHALSTELVHFFFSTRNNFQRILMMESWRYRDERINYSTFAFHLLLFFEYANCTRFLSAKKNLIRKGIIIIKSIVHTNWWSSKCGRWGREWCARSEQTQFFWMVFMMLRCYTMLSSWR